MSDDPSMRMTTVDTYACQNHGEVIPTKVRDDVRSGPYSEGDEEPGEHKERNGYGGLLFSTALDVQVGCQYCEPYHR